MKALIILVCLAAVVAGCQKEDAVKPSTDLPFFFNIRFQVVNTATNEDLFKSSLYSPDSVKLFLSRPGVPLGEAWADPIEYHQQGDSIIMKAPAPGWHTYENMEDSMGYILQFTYRDADTMSVYYEVSYHKRVDTVAYLPPYYSRPEKARIYYNGILISDLGYEDIVLSDPYPVSIFYKNVTEE